jgi:hypothetical protein
LLTVLTFSTAYPAGFSVLDFYKNTWSKEKRRSKMISESIDKNSVNNKGLFVSTDADILFM